MNLEKMVLSLDEAQSIMKKYLEKVIDFVNGEIVRNENGAYIMDSYSYRGEEVKRFKELRTKAYFDILRLALLDAGYPVNHIKEVKRNDEVKYECFYELVSKKGR